MTAVTPTQGPKTVKAEKAVKVDKAVKAVKTPSAKVVDRVGLIVNREAVTMGEIEESIVSFYLSQGRRPPESAAGAEYQKIRKQVIVSVIEELVLSQEAEALSIQVSDKEAEKQAEAEIETIKKRFESPKQFEQGLSAEGLNEEQFKEDLASKLRRQLLSRRVLKMKQEELPSSLLTDDNEVRKAYEGHERDYDQAKFSAIVFRIPDEKRGNAEYKATLVKQAEEMLVELKKGADFSAYARKYSEEPATAEKSGEVGTRYRFELTPALGRGLFALPAKGMGVVPTEEAVYLVRSAYKKTSTFESAAPEIRERLRRDSTEKALTQWIQGLKDKAYIKEIQ